MLVRFKATLPVFDSVTVCAALVVLICWFPKLKLFVDRFVVGDWLPAVVKLHVGPVVDAEPLLATTYHWYCVPGARLFQTTDAWEPDGTFETVPRATYPLFCML